MMCISISIISTSISISISISIITTGQRLGPAAPPAAAGVRAAPGARKGGYETYTNITHITHITH